jgi:anti-sigma-K factor RskA
MSTDEHPIERCDGNAAPYVLGALTEDEHEAFQAHLQTCAICREEVAALQVVAAALPGAAPQLRAPSELRSRVMATVHQEAGLRSSSEPARRPRRAFAQPPRWRGALSLAAIAAAVIALAVIVLPSGTDTGGARVIQAQVIPANASASVRVSAGHAQLSIAGMPQTAPDRVYEVWVKRSGAPQPTNALFTVTAAGDASVGVPGSVDGVKEVLVTSEPLGGSRTPTRSPVIIAHLS